MTKSSSVDRAARYHQDMLEARKKFGEYAFADKGLREVMNLDPILKELTSLDVDDVSATLRVVLPKRFGPKFVETLLVEMQEWDKFEELLKKHDWLELYF
jgi:hypothetical protein